VGKSRIDFVSNEAVSAELLSEQLAQGLVPPLEALRYAIQIGVALQQAHTNGLVHGALSPDCIALEERSAYILRPAGSPAECAAYRAPEQVRGGAADVRSDVFAYGAVLYEMASGRRAFPGTGAELDRAILTQSPPPLLPEMAEELPANSAAVLEAMDAVIAGCLAKEPLRRRQRVQNAVIELKLAAGRMTPRKADGERHKPPRRAVRPSEAATTVSVPTTAAEPLEYTAPLAEVEASIASYEAQPQEPVLRGSRRRWAIAAAALVLVGALAVALVLLFHHPPPREVLKFSVTQPENTSYPGMPSVSPDGKYLTFSAVGPEGKRMLWLRPLDALHARVLEGSEGASAPFWSPDSQAIAFFAGRSLKRVGIAGGAPQNICDAEASPGGGAWRSDGTILFSPSLADGFYRVPVNGGKPQQILKLDESKLERADLWPQFLPGDKHFIFYQQTDLAETSGVYVGTVDPPEYHRLFTSQTNAVYSAETPDSPNSGYLLYINDRNLMAQAFNAKRLETADDAITIGNDIGAVRSMSLAPISVSATGVLVYQGVGRPTRQMIWMDRNGRQISPAGEPGIWGAPRISPDGTRAVVAKAPDEKSPAHLWLLTVEGGAEQISEGAEHEGAPVWSPDGGRIAYFAMQDSVFELFTRAPAPGSRVEPLLKTGFNKYPTDWSHDGRYVLFNVGDQNSPTRTDIWAVSASDRRAVPILDTVRSEAFAALSPDGRWLAYQSDTTGRYEVYVQVFAGLNNGTQRLWQISHTGGGLPRWRADGNELFYATSDGQLNNVAIHVGQDGGIESGQPRLLFQTRPTPGSWNLYDVSPDGQHFLLNIPLEWTSAVPITVLTNWTEKLKQ
jgi:Tol biopolymer transport system component